MEIQYNNRQDFYDGIEELTQRGLTFKANGTFLLIILTGGF